MVTARIVREEQQIWSKTARRKDHRRLGGSFSALSAIAITVVQLIRPLRSIEVKVCWRPDDFGGSTGSALIRLVSFGGGGAAHSEGRDRAAPSDTLFHPGDD